MSQIGGADGGNLTEKGIEELLAYAVNPNVLKAAIGVAALNALRPKAKFLSIIGSYGWGGETVETLAGMISNLKVEVLTPLLCKGLPSEGDFKALDELAAAIAGKHKELNIT